MGTSTQESNNIFLCCKENVAKFFNEVEKLSSKYPFTVTKLQHDYFEAWKNVINLSIAMEREYVYQLGLNPDVPESTLKTIREITQKGIEVCETQNKFAADYTKALEKGFNGFNENTKSFASLNKNMMDYMMSVLKQKPKT